MGIGYISLPLVGYLERFLTFNKDAVNISFKQQLPDFNTVLLGVELELEGLVR
jgi:hypothetical protein